MSYYVRDYTVDAHAKTAQMKPTQKTLKENNHVVGSFQTEELKKNCLKGPSECFLQDQQMDASLPRIFALPQNVFRLIALNLHLLHK